MVNNIQIDGTEFIKMVKKELNDHREEYRSDFASFKVEVKQEVIDMKEYVNDKFDEQQEYCEDTKHTCKEIRKWNKEEKDGMKKETAKKMGWNNGIALFAGIIVVVTVVVGGIVSFGIANNTKKMDKVMQIMQADRKMIEQHINER